MYQCRSCQKVYKTLGWFKRHVKFKQHNPVWEELLPLSKIRKIIREELSKLKIVSATGEPIVRITKTEVTEIPLSKYQRDSKWESAYREVMKELKLRFIDMEKAEVV